MAGSVSGGRQAAATNKTKYGEDFFKRIGALGGANGRTGGFFGDKQRASIAGKLGGTISRRGPKKLEASDRLRLRAEYEKTYAHLLQIHESNKHKSVL